MSKNKKLSLNAELVGVFKINHTLHEAIKAKIVNGEVVAIEFLTRGPDLASIAAGLAGKAVWSSMNTNQPISRGDSEKDKEASDSSQTARRG